MPIKVGEGYRSEGLPKAPQVRIESGSGGFESASSDIRQGAADLKSGLRVLGKGISNLGAGIEDYRTRIQENADDVAALDAENEATMALYEKAAELDNRIGSNAATSLSEWNAFVPEISSKSISKVRSPERAAKVRAIIGEKASRLSARIADNQIKNLAEANAKAMEAKFTISERAISASKGDLTTFNSELAYRKADINDSEHLSPELKKVAELNLEASMAANLFLSRPSAYEDIKAIKDGNGDPNLTKAWNFMPVEMQDKVEKNIKTDNDLARRKVEEANEDYDKKLLMGIMKGSVPLTSETIRAARTLEGTSAIRALIKESTTRGKLTTEEKDNKFADAISSKDFFDWNNAKIVKEYPAIASRLIKYRDDNATNRIPVKESLSRLKDWRDNEVLDESQYNEAVIAFSEWHGNNPSKDPTAWFDGPGKKYAAKGIGERISGWLTNYISGTPSAPIPTTKAAVPSETEWVNAAKAKNPNATEEALRAFYRKKYGR